MNKTSRRNFSGRKTIKRGRIGDLVQEEDLEGVEVGMLRITM
jgi:hypothetical protein